MSMVHLLSGLQSLQDPIHPLTQPKHQDLIQLSNQPRIPVISLPMPLTLRQVRSLSISFSLLSLVDVSEINLSLSLSLSFIQSFISINISHQLKSLSLKTFKSIDTIWWNFMLVFYLILYYYVIYGSISLISI